MASSIIPPGGFAGFSQMSSASRLALSQGVKSTRSSGTKRRTKRSKRTKSKGPRTRKRAASSKKPARLVKGSAAAKAYMAKIRTKRKK